MISVLRRSLDTKLYWSLTKFKIHQFTCTSDTFLAYKPAVWNYNNKLFHDSVKKRALEARSKLKAPNNPNNPIPKNPKEAPKKPKPECKNAQVLQAKDCNRKSSSSSSTGSSPPPPNDANSVLKWLLIGLSAAGIGGLVYVLIKNSESEPTSSKATTSKPSISKRIPASSADIPEHVPYLLIGGGTASFSAFRAIKSHDPKAKVLVISNELYKPYMRPPLSKELWYNVEKGVMPEGFRFKQWNGAERSLFYEPDEFYADPTKLMDMKNGGVSIAEGYSVKKIHPTEQKVILTDGKEIRYDKCLIATGCTAKTLDIFSTAPHKIREQVSVFRNPDDFKNLKNIADTKQSITIVGSGFLGSELACALANYGKSRNLKVYQLFHETGNMAKVLPEYLCKWTTNRVEKQGVSVVSEAQITSVEKVNNSLKLVLNNGKSILTDHVVVCAGCEANTDIASLSGLEVDSKFGGFLVNAELAARTNLYVAGDAACFYDPLLGRRRVEHHDHSVVSGRLAGENMTGLKKHYKHQSMFWSDLGPEIGYEGIGLTDSSLPTVGVFAKMDFKNLLKDRDETKPPLNVAFAQAEIKNSQESIKDNVSSEQTSEIREVSNVTSTSPAATPTPAETEEEDAFRRGVIFYLKDNIIVGIVLWNIFNRIGLARQIINDNKCYDDLNEVAKLFEIHS